MDRKPTYEESEQRIDELEEALRFSEHFTRTIISSVGEGIIVYDRELRYKLWNSFMEDLTGMPAEEVLGKHALEVFPHLREQGIDRLLKRALEGETVYSSDTPYYVAKSQKKGWVQGLYAPHITPEGEIIGVVATVRDQTERKQAEGELRESERRLSMAI